jgi:hypothetical protein
MMAQCLIEGDADLNIMQKNIKERVARINKWITRVVRMFCPPSNYSIGLKCNEFIPSISYQHSAREGQKFCEAIEALNS